MTCRVTTHHGRACDLDERYIWHVHWPAWALMGDERVRAMLTVWWPRRRPR